jgi:uncharacterized membrane protein YccF (DUF307 family)
MFAPFAYNCIMLRLISLIPYGSHVNRTSALGFFPTDLFCDGTFWLVLNLLWCVLLVAEYIMLSLVHSKTGLLENPIKIAFNSSNNIVK